MLNVLLIKNCLRQHKTVYICVFAVLFLSVFSLAFFSAYADSLAYGELLQALEESNGANIKVRNASKEDVSMFDSLEMSLFGMKTAQYILPVIILTHRKTSLLRLLR